MKTPEDEAFDDLAKQQGAWGGGFPAKRQMAMDKINADFDEEYKKMHEDRINYGTAWSQDGKRIDPMSVYKEPVCDKDPQGCWNVRCQLGKQCKNLAQPAQEPVAWMVYTQDGKSVYVTDNPTDIQEGQRALPLYTTPTQPVQEPVAFLDWYENAIWGNEDFQDGCHRAWDAALEHTTPPQREWVGLTAEDFGAIKFPAEMRFPAEFRAGARWAEVKLKDKNT